MSRLSRGASQGVPLPWGTGKYPSAAEIANVMDLSWFYLWNRNPHDHCPDSYEPSIHHGSQVLHSTQSNPIKRRKLEF